MLILSLTWEKNILLIKNTGCQTKKYPLVNN